MGSPLAAIIEGKLSSDETIVFLKKEKDHPWHLLSSASTSCAGATLLPPGPRNRSSRAASEAEKKKKASHFVT